MSIEIKCDHCSDDLTRRKDYIAIVHKVGSNYKGEDGPTMDWHEIIDYGWPNEFVYCTYRCMARHIDVLSEKLGWRKGAK